MGEALVRDRQRSERVEKVKINDSKLAEVVASPVQAYQPERIYLFRSRARGDMGPDSDYDVMVVVPDTAPPERRRSRLGYEFLWGAGLPRTFWPGRPTASKAAFISRHLPHPQFFLKGGCLA